MAAIGQADWGGGIFRGRNAPADSVYDALNALVNDERELFERGATLTKSSAAVAALFGLLDAQTLAGQRTLLWEAPANARLYVLDSNDVTPVLMNSVAACPVGARGASTGLLLAIPSPGNAAILYAGSRKASNYVTGSAAVTQGSKTVTGTGTSWLANVDRGMFLIKTATDFGVVDSVDSNTQITLRDAWAGATGSGGYTLAALATPSTATMPVLAGPNYVAVAGGRVLLSDGTRVYFSGFGAAGALAFDGETFHEMPSAVIGLEGVGTSAVVFTTEGVWAISNLDLDAVDDFGNIQQTVSQVSKDVILWGDPGIAAWGNELLVPAVDDVYLFSLTGRPVPLSEPIRPLYRSYVKEGYKPGLAAVHRAHYFLPILDGSNNVVDVLVCRLDLKGPAWTRWAGHAASPVFAVRVGATTRQPKLLAVNSTRVTDLSNTLDTPSTGTDADGTVPEFDVVTRDFNVGNGMRPSYIDRVRVEYEAAGAAPVVTAGWATGAEGAAVTDLTAQRGGGPSDGTDYSAWRVGKKLDRVRFRVRSTTANTKLILRRLEALVRPDGRR